MAAKKAPGRGDPKPGDQVCIYARYSSHNQKDASIEQQVAECKKYAADLRLHVVEIYADHAISGKTDKRPAFQRLMRDATKGRFAYVIAWKSNRIGRNMLQAMVNESRLEEAGVRCLYTEEDFDNTAAGRFALRSMMNVNQFYSENMAEDIRRGMLDNVEKGLVAGVIPLGYRKAADGSYEIDEAHAAIVREIFERVAGGENYIDIANSLNARGLTTSKGALWNKNSFRSMLANERYRGIYIWSDYRKEGAIPRIISDELFYNVQEVVKMKKNTQGRHGDTNAAYLLTGKLRCGHCKSYMLGVSGTSQNGTVHHYYACQQHLKRACHKRNVRRDYIEQAVARAIQNYALKDDMIEWITDSTIEHYKRKQESSHLSILQSELDAVKSSIQNLMRAIEAGILTPTTRERMLELEAEQSRLTQQIALAKEDIVEIDRDTMIEGLRAFRNGSLSNSRFLAKLFDTFLIAVYLYDDHFKIVFSFSGDKNTIDLPLDLDAAFASTNSPPDSGVPESKVLISSPRGHQIKATHRKMCGFFFAKNSLFSYSNSGRNIE